MRKALSWPARQIAINSGEDGSIIVGKILEKDRYWYGLAIRTSLQLVLLLAEIHRAIQEGVPVEGYLRWSSLDNFEWFEGRRLRFGLIHVDYDTLRRTVKPSGELYANCAMGGLYRVDASAAELGQTKLHATPEATPRRLIRQPRDNARSSRSTG